MKFKLSQGHPGGDNTINLKLGNALTIKGRLLPEITCLRRNVMAYSIQAHEQARSVHYISNTSSGEQNCI